MLKSFVEYGESFGQCSSHVHAEKDDFVKIFDLDVSIRSADFCGLKFIVAHT